MPGLDEQIRDLFEAGIHPVSADEVMDVPAPSGGHRARASRPGVWSVGIAAACIAVVAVAAAVRPSDSQAPLNKAATVLERASLAAASGTGLASGTSLSFTDTYLVHGSYAPLTGSPFNYQIMGTANWTITASGTGEGQLTLGSVSFPTPQDETAFITAGSPDLEPTKQLSETLPLSPSQSAALQAQHGIGGAPAQPSVLPYSEVATLSTNPTTLRTELVQRFESGRFDVGKTIDLAASLLEEGASGPQRAALYKMVAGLPGVTSNGTVVTDVTHQPGTAVSVTEGGIEHQVIFDPTTSTVLEERWTPVGPSSAPPSSAIRSTPSPVDHQSLAYTVFGTPTASQT